MAAIFYLRDLVFERQPAVMFSRPTTHAGKFHADEVCAMAFLLVAKLIEKPSAVIRSLDPAVHEKADILVDIGRVYDPEHNRFDHHQPEFNRTRQDETPYASYGLVVEKFADRLLKPDEYTIFDRIFVRPIDAGDCGVQLYTGDAITQGHIISGYMPQWNEKQGPTQINKAFYKAVAFARDTIENQIKYVKALVEADKLVDQAFTEAEDDRVIFLPSYMPWRERVATNHPSVYYVAYPHLRGGWAAEAAVVTPGEFATRLPFPPEWAGLKGKPLQQITGVEDADFCHRGRFLATSTTKDGIKKLVSLALKQLDRERVGTSEKQTD